MKLWKQTSFTFYGVYKKRITLLYWQDVLTVGVWFGTDVSTLVQKSITDNVFTSLTVEHRVLLSQQEQHVVVRDWRHSQQR